MPQGRVIIVGSGVIGLATALTAREAGWEVTVIERHNRPLGASVRNFGTLWPIGCVPGPERDQALFGVKRWRELAEEAGFWIRPTGSLSLAYREEAWAVLNEFSAQGGCGTDEFSLLQPEEVLKRFPAANAQGLCGALYSTAETVVNPPSAIAALVALAQRRGVKFCFEQPVVRVLESQVETSAGEHFEFDHLVIAGGEEMRLLFPAELAAANLTPCRLQMMRTVPQPAGFDLGAIFVSDLTLCHYAAFRDCPSTMALRSRLEEELPLHRQWGVHVIAAQHFDGSLVLGDSHEYGADFSPDSYPEVEDLILSALRDFACIPDLRLAARWQGIYLKSTVGQTQVVLHPQERVTMVTAMGGLGMTFELGLGEKDSSCLGRLIDPPALFFGGGGS